MIFLSILQFYIKNLCSVGFIFVFYSVDCGLKVSNSKIPFDSLSLLKAIKSRLSGSKLYKAQRSLFSFIFDNILRSDGDILCPVIPLHPRRILKTKEKINFIRLQDNSTKIALPLHCCKSKIRLIDDQFRKSFCRDRQASYRIFAISKKSRFETTSSRALTLNA